MTVINQRAFTLTEILVCLMIVAMLGSISVPLVKDLVQANRKQNIQESLKSALHLARTHSVTHRMKVELCGSSDGLTCDNAWHAGWLIREHGSRNVIRSEPHKATGNLIWRGFSKTVRFIPSGHSNFSNGTFTYCDEQSNASWQLVLNRQGRTRLILADSIKEMPCGG